MKKFLLLLFLLFFLPFTTAQEAEETVENQEVVSAGITPEYKLFWWFDKMFEKLELKIAKQEYKNEVRLKHAEERTAEIQALLEKKLANKEQYIGMASQEYEKEISEINEGIPQDVKQKVLANLQKHVTVLQRIRTEISVGRYGEELKGIENAISVGERNIKRFEEKVYK